MVGITADQDCLGNSVPQSSERKSTCVGLATCAALPVGDVDDAGFVAALNARDLDVHWVTWTADDPSRLSRAIDLLVLRSPWDYTDDRDSFLTWLAAVDVPVFNPVELVRWNSDKRYILELAAAGVPTVPTAIVESPEQPLVVPEGFEEFVVKPSVDAGSKGAERYRSTDADRARDHARRLLRSGCEVLVQPYIPSVDSGSETGLIYLDGRFSHAIAKGPMLKREGKAELVDGLYVAETIDPRTPTDAQLEVAQQVLAALPVPGALYARVDLIDAPDGSPMLLELEMIEPSLFFAFHPPAADALVRAIQARL